MDGWMDGWMSSLVCWLTGWDGPPETHQQQQIQKIAKTWSGPTHPASHSTNTERQKQSGPPTYLPNIYKDTYIHTDKTRQDKTRQIGPVSFLTHPPAALVELADIAPPGQAHALGLARPLPAVVVPDAFLTCVREWVGWFGFVCVRVCVRIISGSVFPSLLSSGSYKSHAESLSAPTPTPPTHPYIHPYTKPKTKPKTKAND